MESQTAYKLLFTDYPDVVNVSRCVKCSVASAIKLPINSCAPVRSGALSLAVTIVFRS